MMNSSHRGEKATILTAAESQPLRIVVLWIIY